MDSGSGFVRFFCRDSFPEQSVLIFGGGTSGNALKDLAEIMLPFKADNPGDLLDGNISAPHDLLGVNVLMYFCGVVFRYFLNRRMMYCGVK